MSATVSANRIARYAGWLLIGWAVAGAALAAPAPRADVAIIDATRPINTFTPDETLGAALDGMSGDEVNLYLTPFNIEKMRSAGLRRVTYRTRPELGIEVWHWSAEGDWSDAAHQQGYWTGDDNPSREPAVTYGYSLPRRGNSVDNANNLGYSRIDDGDPDSFWKSNPYLDRHFTGAAESRPQWVVLSLDRRTPIDAVRILWGAPFARHYLVQYWNGDDSDSEGGDADDGPGRWTTFPDGDRTVAGAPDEAVVRLAQAPIQARFIRILMLQSSETGPPGSTDIRDRLGYAVREVSLGVARADGGLDDAVRHGKTQADQTLSQVSSTDPWHRASDLDPETEQPSLDLVFRTGLNGGMPLMAPVGVFFDTPENAAAELRYIRRRGWPVRQIELGEEPDGQFIDPEDYADLYLQTARALHGIDPTLSLGGPSMQDAVTDTWPDPEEGSSWVGRFVARLKARGGLEQFGFFSFENYAFDDTCRPIGSMLRGEDGLMDKLMRESAAAGVPKTIPWVISEYGFSPFAGRAMSEVPSGLLAADIVGRFLAEGGATAFMFGYPPHQPANQRYPCAGYGDMMLFEADDDGRSHWPMPVYYAERMMMQDWGAPADQPHRLYAAHARIADARGRAMVMVYPVRRPDGRWSVMLVNRDEARAHSLSLVLRDHGALHAFGAGRRLDLVQYSAAQYRWLDRGEFSRPARDLPPARRDMAGGGPILLPALSLTVVTEQGAGT